MMREGEDDVCTGIGTILQLLNFRKFFLIYLWLLLLTEYGNLNLITATFNCYYQIIIIQINHDPSTKIFQKFIIRLSDHKMQTLRNKIHSFFHNFRDKNSQY